VGLHPKEDKVGWGLRVKLAVAELPLRLAVNTAAWTAGMAPAVSTTPAMVAPGTTVREAGDARKLLLLLRLTEVPPAGAACEMVTLQVVERPEPSVVGLQANEAKVGGGVRVRLAVAELPFRVAVRTAGWAAGSVPAVSTTPPVVAPAATVREAGDARKLLLLLRLIEVPPAVAACEMVTLQVVALPELTVVGLQPNETRAGRTNMVPPAAERITELAGAEAARVLARTIFVLAALAESVNWAVATSPFGITVSFGPVATQVSTPGLAPQVRLFEAAVRPGAAVTVTPVILAGYWKLHCKPATWLFPESLKVRPRATVPPARPEPDANDKVVCPQHAVAARIAKRHLKLRIRDKAVTCPNAHLMITVPMAA
jgi:hypothetical protein